jgi:hypothetical protein
MVKNIERQRAKKIYKKEQEQDPPGVCCTIKISSIAIKYFLGSNTITSDRL